MLIFLLNKVTDMARVVEVPKQVSLVFRKVFV